ncbi:MAG: hypothetical protein ACREC5_06005 [Thermoplasmata archaeon]
MSSTSQGAGSGAVLGVVLVLLAQQLGFLGLSALVPALEYLLAGALLGGVLGGLLGWELARR